MKKQKSVNDILKLFKRREKLLIDLRKINNKIESYNMMNYILDHIIETKSNKFPNWNNIQFFIEVNDEEGYKSFDAWREWLDMTYAKRIYTDHNYDIDVFDNGVDKPLAFTKLGDKSDIRKCIIKEIKKNRIYCTYKLDCVSNMTGEIFETFSGDFSISVNHFMNWLNEKSNSKPSYKIPDAPIARF